MSPGWGEHIAGHYGNAQDSCSVLVTAWPLVSFVSTMLSDEAKKWPKTPDFQQLPQSSPNHAPYSNGKARRGVRTLPDLQPQHEPLGSIGIMV
jgi:hypothetical protein